MKFSLSTLIWSFVLIAATVVGVMAFRSKPIEVETAVVRRGDLRISIAEDGKTRIREKYIVSTPVAGRLSRIELKPGDEICGENQLIAVILPAEPEMLDARAKAQAESRVEQARTAVQRAAVSAEQIQVDYELAKNQLERAERLIVSKAVSQDEYDVTKSQYLSLLQDVRTAAFDKEIAEYELQTVEAALLQFSEDDQFTGKPFEVFAPVCGKVLRVFQESATVVSVGMPLVELGDPSNLEIEVDVLSKDAVKIHPGSELIVKHWGGKQPLLGTVKVVEPAAFTKISSLGVEEQRVNVIASIDSPTAQFTSLGDGFRVEADITLEELADVLLVPNSALFRHQREWHVFVVEQGQAKMRSVTVGAQNDRHSVIESGLDLKEEVIVYPSDAIAEDAQVIPSNRDSEP